MNSSIKLVLSHEHFLLLKIIDCVPIPAGANVGQLLKVHRKTVKILSNQIWF